MIRNTLATRLAHLAGVALSIAGFTALEAGAQSKVRLNNGNECVYTAITVAPNGDVTVSCDTGGGSTGTPACSIAGPSSATKGAPFTLTANCSNGPITAYAWSANNGATAPSGSGGPVTLNSVGNFTFTVQATNATGQGAVSAGLTVNVTEPQQVTGKPACTFSANPATPVAGQPASVLFTCTNSPNSFAWYQYEGAALGLATQTSAGTQSVTFPSAGKYSFWLQAGNDQFGGGEVFSGSVTVNPPAGSSGCPTVSGVVGPSGGYDTLSNLRFDLKPGQIGSALVDMPLEGVYTAAQVTAVGATQLETPKNTIGEIAIAPCPGNFDVPAGCKMQVYGTTGMNFIIGGASCPVASGKHYVNVRHLTCTPAVNMGISYCSHYVKLNGR